MTSAFASSPTLLPTPAELLAELVALPGPPGQEGAVLEAVKRHVETLGLTAKTDAKGNLLVALSDAAFSQPQVVVTAHLDEIALLVTHVEEDATGGIVRVSALGGVQPWKWGEGPVDILTGDGNLTPGVLSFGGIHTTHPASTIQAARDGRVVTWDAAWVVTGLPAYELAARGVRPGTRVVLGKSRRVPLPLGLDLVASPFLDDRADLVAWLLVLEALRDDDRFASVLFAATASEEVGGEGALYLLHKTLPDVCVALEIGPTTPDNPFPIDDQPTVWVTDAYATTTPRDLDLIARAAQDEDLAPHFHAVTRGGSDASCAASRGLCARPVTLAFAAENSHGFEIMHRDAPTALARLTVAYLRRLLTP